MRGAKRSWTASALAGCSLLALSVAVPVQAQSWPEQTAVPSSAAGSAAVAEVLQETEVATLAPVVLEGPGGQVKASLEELIESPEGRGLDAVRLVGRATLSRETGEASISWNMVEAEGKRGEGSAPLREGLRSRMPLRGAQLPRNSRVVAVGDVDDMVAIARRLLEELDAEEEEAEEGGLVERGGTAGMDGAPGSGGGENASDSYQPITPPERERDPEDPIIYTYTTVDGCDIRVDFARGEVVQQEREVELTDGRQTGDSGCYDSGASYAIQYGTTGCADAIDISARVARAQQRPFYVDDSGIRRDLGACAPMDDVSWPLVADFDACSPVADAASLKVTRRYQLGYEGSDGQLRVVQACQEDPAELLPVEFAQAGCSDIVDLGQRTAQPQHKPFYVDRGVRHEFGECRPAEGTTFAIEADYEGCPPAIDSADLTAFRRFQLGYRDGEGKQQLVQGCTTDPSAALAIQFEAADCGDQVDFDRRMAQGQHKAFYVDRGVRHSIGSCMPNEALTYPLTSNYAACDVEVDLEANEVTLRYQLGYVPQSGLYQSVGDCQRDENSLPIEYATSSCSDEVDLEAFVARPRHKPFYVDLAGVRRDLADCEAVPDRSFALLADYDACSPLVDVEARVVTKRYQLGYQNEAGLQQLVGGCRNDEAAMLAITETRQGCDWQHDLAEDFSVQTARLVYVDAGTVHTVTECSELPATRVDHRWDTEGCDPIIDLNGRSVTPRARRMLDFEGTSTALSACAPASWMAASLRSTFDGCSDRLVHNEAGRQSFETWRWFHTLNGSRTYVTDCELAEAPALPHRRDTVDWQHDDARKRSTPLERIYVVSRAGEFEVSSARVQSDHTKQPYSFVRTRTVQVGPYYEGCDRYIEREEVEQYTRPDGSRYDVVVGSASPLGPNDQCQRKTERRQYVERLYGTGNWTNTTSVQSCGDLNNPRAVVARSGGDVTASLNCEARIINCREGGGGDGGNIVCTNQLRLWIDNPVNDGKGRFDACVVLSIRSLAVPNIRQEGRVEERDVLIYPNGTQQNGSWETINRFNQSLGCQ